MPHEEFGTDEELEDALDWLSYEEFGTDEVHEVLDMASRETDQALGAADGALESIWSAASSGLVGAVDTATGLASRALGGLSDLLLRHSKLLTTLIERGLATFEVYQQLQAKVQIAKAKKGELEEQLAALLAGRPTAGGGTTVTVTSPGGGGSSTGSGAGAPGLAPEPAGPNYAAYGLAALGAAALAWILARR